MRVSLLFLLLATALSKAAESPDPGALSASDDALVRELESKSWVAWKAHDAAFFEQFLADDHVEVHGYGITDKKAVVAGVRSPSCAVQSYALGPFTVTRTSTDSVLVTYRAEQDTLCGGARVPSPVWATSLYVKRSGRWVNVLYQHTPAAGADDAAVASVVSDFHAALKAGDARAASRLLAPDAVILEGGDRETRKEYLDHHLQEDIKFAQSVPARRGKSDVTVSGDTAWAVSTSTMQGTFQSKAIDLVGAELMVLSKTPAGWVIRSIHWSSRSAT